MLNNSLSSISFRLDTIAASSYGNGTISSGTVKITKELKTDIVGRNVLLVDDVFFTEASPSSLKILLIFVLIL